MFFDTRYNLNLLEVSCQTACAAAATEITGRLGWLSVYGREAILASFFASLIDGIAQKIFKRRHPMRHLAAAASGFIGVAFQPSASHRPSIGNLYQRDDFNREILHRLDAGPRSRPTFRCSNRSNK